MTSAAAAPPPPLPRPLAEALQAVVGTRAVISDPDRLLVYESDGLTQYRMPPAAVVLPATPMELRAVIGILAREGRSFVMRGAGTGLSGGALAVDGGVVVGTARLHRILEVSPQDRRAWVEPGVVNSHLTRAAAPHGLIYAPDPSSQSACTLGGNVAENSGGPHCLKYGVTSRYVTGLRVVLPDGSEAELGGMGREDEGLDLVGLFVGSEGCFGAATGIELSLVPAPRSVRTLLALFSSVEAAGIAVTSIMARGLLPAALEIVDRETIRAVEASVFAAGYPTHVAAALVVEFDGMEEGLDEEVELAAALCREAGAEEVRMAATEGERAALWQGRKKAFGAMGRIAPDLLVQDATVPRSRLPQVLGQIREIGEKYGLRVANVFHAGDGNLHPNLLFDRRDPEELARVEAASGEIMEACIQAGGTITGEHGVGLDKRRYMHRVYTRDVLERMGEVKAVFDPEGRCNPGKVLPDGFGPSPGVGLPPRTGPGLGSDPRPGGRDRALTRIQDALSPDAVASVGGVPVVSPGDEEEVAAVLRMAAEHQVPVQPLGGGVERPLGTEAETGAGDAGWGLLPDAFGGILLSTGRLGGEPNHAPEDLQVQVPAGIPLEALQRVLATRGHWLPVEPPGGGRVSVGGLVATGVSGPLAAGTGRVRDQLLGLTLVDGGGRVLPLGGRVVKNVAGFDLVRLAGGSRGALGVITSVTLRLFPLPPRDRTLIWILEDVGELEACRAALLGTGAPLAALEAGADPGPDPSDPARIFAAARIHGSAEGVEGTARLLERAAGPPDRTLEGDDSRGWWGVAAEREAQGDLLFRAGGLPGTGPARLATLLPLLRVARVSLALGLLDGSLRTLAPPAEGRAPGGAIAAETGEVAEQVAAPALDRLAEAGSLRVLRWPARWKAEGILPPAAPAPGEARSRTRALETGILACFDPAGILPGRWDPPRWRGRPAHGAAGGAG